MQINIANILEEVSLLLSSAAKQAGIAANVLSPLQWEAELVVASVKPVVASVDATLLAGPISARAVLQPVMEAYESDHVTTTVADIVRSKEHDRAEPPPPNTTHRTPPTHHRTSSEWRC